MGTLTFLGTGTSTGVPVLGCDCNVCTSTNPKNQRYRCSILLAVPKGRILVDTPPELRLALLREKAPFVHAILLTHYHVDHLYGMDDVRIFPKHLSGPLQVYCNEETEAVVRRAFSYAFGETESKASRGFVPQIHFVRIEAGVPLDVLGEQVIPIALEHGRFRVLGFRFGDVAYCTDVSKIQKESMDSLRGLKILVLDALRRRYHPNHFSLDEALAVINELQPKQAYLTHMSHELDHDEVSAELPSNVHLAYDGLKLEF
jgi:phosphoribosyl 1,2-cyclic phosphate phosphodiesterase